MFGWIALYRAMMEHWIWNTSSQRLKRWIYILFCVAWQEKVVGFGDKEVTLKRGQMVTSVRRLMGMWNTNSTTVRNTLDAFVEHGMIELKKEPNMTIITVLNYDKYQQSIEEVSFAAMPPPQAQAWEQEWVHNKQYIKNNIINNPSHPIKREEDFFEEFKKSDITIEYAMKELHLSKDEVFKWLEKFRQYNTFAEKEHRDLSDFKLHFLGWVRTKQEHENGTNSKKQGRSESAQDKYSARRGTDAGDKSEKDYDTSF